LLWTASWTELSVQTVRSGPPAARLHGIRAGSAYDAPGRTSHNPPAVGSSPTRPTCRAAARLGRHGGLAARPVRVDSRVGRVHPRKQPRVYPADNQTPLGSTQVRKVRGPLLDTLYARLMGCGNLACTGKPFTEHRNVRTSGPTRPTRATSAIGGPVSRTSRTAPYVKSRSNFLRISAIALSFL
jgi:hypothetical protein